MNWFEEWMFVLRDPKSEKFKGGLESVENPNARCCLGHLCHVFHRRGLIERVVDSHRGTVSYSGHSLGLPEKVQEMTGLKHEGTFTSGDSTTNTLSFINDRSHLTPAQIADYIEDLNRNGTFGELKL